MRRAFPSRFCSVVQAQGGLRSVFDLFSGDIRRFPLVGFPVTQKFAESNPNTVAALQRALAKGLKFAHNNPEKLRDIYPTFTTFSLSWRTRSCSPTRRKRATSRSSRRSRDLMDRLQMLPGKTKLPDVAMPK